VVGEKSPFFDTEFRQHPMGSAEFVVTSKRPREIANTDPSILLKWDNRHEIEPGKRFSVEVLNAKTRKRNK